MKHFTFIILITASILNGSFASAKDIEIRDPEVRKNLLRNAQVWLSPSWIQPSNDGGFQFDPNFDITRGPELKPELESLRNDDVYCKVTEDDLEKPSGTTAKFNCRLMVKNSKTGKLELLLDKKGEAKKLKVKYGNAEVNTESFSTRFLWALGFGADQVYYIPRIHCFGCTSDPFKDRQIDKSSLSKARVFDGVAIEVKLPGDEIVYRAPMAPGGRERPTQAPAPKTGFWITELISNRSRDKSLKDTQRVHRDALRLLAVFLRNADIKPSNNRLMCVGDVGNKGPCKGQVVAYMQDVGVSLGGGAKGLLRMTKADLAKWQSKEIWDNPRRCLGNLGWALDFNMQSPQITDEGRVFLSQLLRAFTEGPGGQRRVEDLFDYAHLDPAYGARAEWIATFKAKINEIHYPMGPAAKDFRCSKTID